MVEHEQQEYHPLLFLTDNSFTVKYFNTLKLVVYRFRLLEVLCSWCVHETEKGHLNAARDTHT